MRTSLIGPGRQLQFLLFREREDFGRVHSGRALPEVDLAAIARDHSRGEFPGRSQQVVEVVLPEVDPVGEAAGVELDQGARANFQPMRLAPLNLRVADGPGELPLAGPDLSPADGHDRHVESRQEMGGRRSVQQGSSQVAAQQGSELGRTAATDGNGLLGVGVGQQLRGVQGRASDCWLNSAATAGSSCRTAAQLQLPDRFDQFLAHARRRHQPDHLPVEQLVANLVDRSPGPTRPAASRGQAAP